MLHLERAHRACAALFTLGGGSARVCCSSASTSGANLSQRPKPAVVFLFALVIVCRGLRSMDAGGFAGGRGRRPAVPDKVDMSLGKILGGQQD